MKRFFALAILGLLSQANIASAQYSFAPGFGGGFSSRSQQSFSFGGPGFNFSSYSYSRGFYAAPILPIYYSYGWVPAFGPGYGPGFGNPFFLPQPPFAGPIIPVANNVPMQPGNDVVPALAVKGVFLVITPKGTSVQKTGEAGTISPMVDRVADPQEKPVPPIFRFDPTAKRPVFGEAEVPLMDAAAEAASQIKRAREAFAREEYGRAVEHIDRAIRAVPDDESATFLKGQAQFAAGQYSEAVATLQAGIKRTPNWPANGFLAKEPFAKGELFEAQLVELRRAAAANPAQASLQFLLAYQLWFSGERDEATRLFQNLATRLKDVNAVMPFLRK